MIREGGRRGAAPNCAHFRRELGVSRRTLMRDLVFLRDEENAPIAFVASALRYQLTNPTYQLPPIQLTRSEVFSFSIARKLLAQFEGTPLALDLRAVMRKIGESLEGTVSLDLEALTDHFSVLSEDHARVDSGVWQAVAKAINQQERLRMDYQPFDGVTGTYWVEPYHLAAYHGNWYLLARNVRADKMATFALSRCRSLARAGEHFQRALDFDARAVLQQGFGITGAAQAWKVRLLFSRQVATYIKERVWHPSQQFRERRDGRLKMRLETTGNKELVRWILSWMPEVNVLTPRELKARVVARLKAGLRINVSETTPTAGDRCRPRSRNRGRRRDRQ